METFTLGATWYRHRFKHERFFLCWQRERCRVEQSEAVFFIWLCFCLSCIHADSWNQPGWNVSKETVEFMESEYGWRAKQVLAILECFLWLRQERSNIWWERPTLSLYHSATGKNTFFNLPNVHVWLYKDKNWQSTCHDIHWGSSFP